MLLKTKGIIFRAIKYSETSLIVDIYTAEKGLKKFIVSGVRSSKARMHANLFQIMTLLDIVVYDRPGKDLNRLKEAKNAFVYQNIPFEIQKSTIGMFMIEVARKTIRETEENPVLYDFLERTYIFLDQTQKPIANIHLLFLIQLSAYLGFTPSFDWSKENPYFDMKEGVFVQESPRHPLHLSKELSAILAQLLESDYDQVHEVAITRAERAELLEKILLYFKLHIDNFPSIHSHTILKTVLE